MAKRLLPIAVLVLFACATAPKVEQLSLEDAEYVLGAEDVIEVSIFQSPDLSRTLPVRPDGRISLPLVGEVMASGLTARELGAELERRLGAYVQDPRVTVIVQEIHAPRVYVLGEVARPGAYPVRGRLDLLQAIALAGGLGDFANPRRIVLIRKTKEGEQRHVLNYSRFVSSSSASIPVILPGDTIYVP